MWVTDDASPPLPAPPGLRWEGPLLVPDTSSLPFGSPTDDSADLSALKRTESCPTCRELLDAIEQLDEPERSQALVEYGEYTSRVNDPDAGMDEMRAALDNAPLLRRLLGERFDVDDLDERLRGFEG